MGGKLVIANSYYVTCPSKLEERSRKQSQALWRKSPVFFTAENAENAEKSQVWGEDQKRTYCKVSKKLFEI